MPEEPEEPEEPVPVPEPVKPKKENKMYKWARLYSTTENFMSELYTKEKVDELNVLCKGDKRLVGFHLWKSFPIATKRSMFS